MSYAGVHSARYFIALKKAMISEIKDSISMGMLLWIRVIVVV